MKQEELKVALCGYYPHEVKVMDEDSQTIQYVLGIYEDILYLTLSRFPYRVTAVLNKTRPILYNISTLTKPIIVKGYNGGLPFVPIEEIAKIECPAIENSIDRIKNIISFNRGVSFGSTKMGVVYEYEGVVVEITHFRNGVFHKSVIKGNDSWVFSKFHNYPQIIEFLNMCLIDYRNLIGQGLAIDVETLKENCYE